MKKENIPRHIHTLKKSATNTHEKYANTLNQVLNK